MFSNYSSIKSELPTEQEEPKENLSEVTEEDEEKSGDVHGEEFV